MTDTTTTTERKIRTITLTGRPPIRIVEEDWPAFANGEVDDWHASSGIRRDAGRITTVTIRVRQHDDGRTVVYGVWDYSTRWQGERDRTERAGVLLPRPGGYDAPGRDTWLVWPDLIETIHRVGATLAEQSGDEERTTRAVRECIADLPAETL